MTTWLSGATNPLSVLRFLGTSPDSSSIIPLLTSLCRQIRYHFSDWDEGAREEGEEEIGGHNKHIPSELNPLVNYFRSLLSLASPSQPITIFLDSIDQLSTADGAHQLTWFPLHLPLHCKLIVSVVPDYLDMLNRVQKVLRTPACYLQINPLGESVAIELIRIWLSATKRTVTQEQFLIVSNVSDLPCCLRVLLELSFIYYNHNPG